MWMGATITARKNGLTKAQKNCDKIGAGIEHRLAEKIVSGAKKRGETQGTRKTGYFLDRSWFINKNLGHTRLGSRAKYFIYLELGTSRMKARPMLIPELIKAEKESFKIARDVVIKELV